MKKETKEKKVLECPDCGSGRPKIKYGENIFCWRCGRKLKEEKKDD